MLARLLKTVVDFWIKPVRAEPLAAFRICIALIVLIDTSFTLLPYATDWFGAHGLYPADSIKSFVNSYWRWSLLPPDASDTTVRLGLWALIAFAATSVLGLFTRVSTVGMWALLVSYQMRNPVILNGGDILLRASTFCLVLMPSGAAWRLDNLLRRKLMRPIQPALWRKLLCLPLTHVARWEEVFRGESSTGLVRPWSLRIAQIQLVIVYFYTGVDKVRGVQLNGSLGDWVGGKAVGLALSHGTIARFGFLAGWPWWIFAPATWITLAWEIAFPVLVLWKRTRWYALSFGYVLHVGIFATMEVTHFSWTILSFYWLMIPGAVLIDMAGKATGSVEKRIYTVFYDGM
ncbi:MAG: HTTM domain-containing protein, partial [Planctomycetes bacterium]|nr:HTTM domain-containing protein [Planctomycetota bacterium]